MYQGRINDEIQDRLKAQLIQAIFKFRFDGCFRLCCQAVKRAQSDKPLTLSIHYECYTIEVDFPLINAALQQR